MLRYSKPNFKVWFSWIQVIKSLASYVGRVVTFPTGMPALQPN